MNKRQKKKKEKREFWNEKYAEYVQKALEEERELMKNREGYRDTTAGIALRNLIRKGY